MNETASGARLASTTARGSTGHRASGLVPMADNNAAPTTKPTTVPAMARHTVEPVVKALDRSTDKAPRTTQNRCWGL